MATRKQTPPKRRGATSSRRQASRPRREWRLPGWVWGLAGLVGGFLLSQHQHGVAPWQVEDSPLATVLPRSAPPEPEAAAPAKPSEPRMPTFEFYTLLPESEVIAPRGEMPSSTARPPAPPPAEETAAAEAGDDPIAQVIAANLAADRSEAASPAAEPAPQAAADNGHRYMLQAASFRESGDAQQLQRRLRDFGLLAQVSEVKASGGETWHRVQVGPYDDNRELSRAQDLMVTQGIEPLLIRLQN
ncbi:SPOR domain-containing protein [Halomonas alkalicola]|uniref:SPOR domain-containing protein n=1 Tax=Halomonas alkalicola TaxID=1930622 RepID=A0ABY9H2E4_9GAMM|nr:SPOR domain-containing protein [Halomonas alkalicola]WLI72564.1 SPOR domain-containing protein [Halomonas alkalicola]